MSLLISGLLAVIIISVFFYIKHKKQEEITKQNRFGRRGKKSHIWQILKEYHKKKGIRGTVIECFYIYDRPNLRELHSYLKRGYIHKSKIEANLLGIKYKPIIPNKFAEEEYFKELEEETGKMHVEADHRLRSKIGSKFRKRYVILYKTSKNGIVSDWNAIEVEILKKYEENGRLKKIVVVNKELDFYKEELWIAPLLNKDLEDEMRRMDNKNKKSWFRK